MVMAVIYIPSENHRRPRGDYINANITGINIQSVTQFPHTLNAKLLVMGEFNHWHNDWLSIDLKGGEETWEAKLVEVATIP